MCFVISFVLHHFVRRASDAANSKSLFADGSFTQSVDHYLLDALVEICIVEFFSKCSCLSRITATLFHICTCLLLFASQVVMEEHGACSLLVGQKIFPTCSSDAEV